MNKSQSVNWARTLARVQKIRVLAWTQQDKFYNEIEREIYEHNITWEVKKAVMLKNRNGSGRIHSTLDTVLTDVCRKREGKTGRVRLVD